MGKLGFLGTNPALPRSSEPGLRRIGGMRLFAASLLLSVSTALAYGAGANPHGADAHAAPAADADVMTAELQRAMTPQQAFDRLKAGNARFLAGQATERNLLDQVHATGHGQYPFASIVSCIDSRTSVELLFDLGIGDTFNARVAGNIVNDDILGSLEYAHKVAGAKLLVVMGHTHCGAVKGAADDVVLGNLTGLLARIRPAVASIPEDGSDRSSKNHDFIDKAARMNVILTIRALRERSQILREMHDSGAIDILGAFYDVETGKVEFYRPIVGGKGDAPTAAAPAPRSAPPAKSTPSAKAAKAAPATAAEHH